MKTQEYYIKEWFKAFNDYNETKDNAERDFFFLVI